MNILDFNKLIIKLDETTLTKNENSQLTFIKKERNLENKTIIKKINLEIESNYNLDEVSIFYKESNTLMDDLEYLYYENFISVIKFKNSYFVLDFSLNFNNINIYFLNNEIEIHEINECFFNELCLFSKNFIEFSLSDKINKKRYYNLLDPDIIEKLFNKIEKQLNLIKRNILN